jgi:hypothetical protein
MRTQLVLALLSCACARPAEPTAGASPAPSAAPPAPERWEQLEQTCSLADNPPTLAAESIGEAREALVRVPVRVDPHQHFDVRWAALGGWDSAGDLFWKPARVEPELRAAPQRRDFKLILGWRHDPSGALEITVAPFADGYSAQVAQVTIRPEGEQLIAELRGFLSQDYDPFRIYWEWIQGEVRVSSPSWAAGDELSVFVEVAATYGLRICAELRLKVPEPGERRGLTCGPGDCG